MQAALRDVPLKAGRVQGFTKFGKVSSNLSADLNVLQQHNVTKNNRLHVARKGEASNDTVFVSNPDGSLFVPACISGGPR